MTESSYGAPTLGTRMKSDETSGIHVPRVSLDTALSAAVDSVDIPKLAAAVLASDALANPTTAPVLSHKLLWNGTTWEREESNLPLTLFGSSAKTATANSADQTNRGCRGVEVYINVTASSATPSVVPKIQGKDPVSGAYFDILTGAAITGAGLTRLVVYPGVTVAANVAVSDVIPRTWRVRMEHADADSITYSVGAVLHR